MLRSLVAPGVGAVRRFRRPFVLLQACVLGVVFAYYHSAVARLCQHLADVKQAAGILFTAGMAALAGAILPELAKAVVPGERAFDPRRHGDILFALVAFAVMGVITDYQYRAFALLIGDDARIGTAIKKMLADQFVTTPIYGVPYWALLYSWKNNAFNARRTLREIGPRWYLTRVVALLLPNWAYWIPMTLLIYSLPSGLQFCLYPLVLAGWSLIMLFVADRRPSADDPAAPVPTPEAVTTG